MEEVWFPIAENPKFGFVSNLGRIKNAKGQIRKSFLSNNGYLRVGFCGGKFTRAIHRMVAEAFIGAPLDKQVNHKDGNKQNNTLFNLEYVTASENVRHAYDLNLRVNTHRKAKIPMEDKPIILARISAGETQRAIAKEYGVTASSICVYLKGRKTPNPAYYSWR